MGEGTVNFADVPNISHHYMQRMMDRAAPYAELCEKIAELESSSAMASSSMPTPVASVSNDNNLLRKFVDKELDELEKQQAEETPAAWRLLRPLPEEEEKKEEEKEKPQMMEVEPEAPKTSRVRAGLVSSESHTGETILTQIDEIKILGDGQVETYEYSVGLTSGNFQLSVREKTAQYHKSAVAHGKKPLYNAVVDEFDAAGTKVCVHTIELCPVSAINKHFRTDFDLSGKGNVGHMNKSELGTLLNRKVVEPIVKQMAIDNANVLARLDKLTTNVEQMTETFSAKLDASA